MGVPAKTKAFSFMAEELHLGVDSSGGQAGVFGAIPDHDTAIRAHRCDDIRVLWLIAGLVDLPFVINLLENVELDLHLGLLRASAVTTDLSPVFIIIFRVGNIRVGELDIGNLKVVLRFTSSVCADQKTVSRVRLVWDPRGNLLERGPKEKVLKMYVLLLIWQPLCCESGPF